MYIGCAPVPVIVTTRIITLRAENPPHWWAGGTPDIRLYCEDEGHCFCLLCLFCLFEVTGVFFFYNLPGGLVRTHLMPWYSTNMFQISNVVLYTCFDPLLLYSKRFSLDLLGDLLNWDAPGRSKEFAVVMGISSNIWIIQKITNAVVGYCPVLLVQWSESRKKYHMYDWDTPPCKHMQYRSGEQNAYFRFSFEELSPFGFSHSRRYSHCFQDKLGHVGPDWYSRVLSSALQQILLAIRPYDLMSSGAQAAPAAGCCRTRPLLRRSLCIFNSDSH